MNEPDYIHINRKLWNAKTPIHVDSAFYGVEAFKQGAPSLKSPELDLLGDISGLRILHLQCHFGQDSLSMARMGAQVTGVDLSDEAIKQAQQLNQELGLDAQFIRTDLYSLPELLNQQFDIVFTSYGTTGWLPDLEKWAGIVERYLKPGGKFIMVDFHPVVWMFDDQFTTIAYSYFNQGPIIEETSGTYTDRDADIHETSCGWNHSISEHLSSLLEKGLELAAFKEYSYSVYDCFQQTVKTGDDRWEIQQMEGKLPLMFSILAHKKRL